MEGLEIRKKLTCLFMLVVLVAPYAAYSGLASSQQDSGHFKNFVTLSQNTPIGPITVMGDAEFESEGFSGSGTAGDPYMLERSDINATVNAITIVHTSSHFSTSIWPTTRF